MEDLSIDAKTVLYRVLQEALNNVGRHSAADAIEIRCQKYKGWIRLKIKDNGSGFDVSRVFGNSKHIDGYGLHSMKERMEICKGKFQIHSAPGKGTTIVAAIPLSSA